MARRKKKKNQNPPTGRHAAHRSPESPTAETLTVAWVICILTVAACDLGAAATRLSADAFDDAPGVALLSGLLLFAAAIIGLLCVVLTPVVVRIRVEPPPPGLIVFALVVSAAPLLVMYLC